MRRRRRRREADESLYVHRSWDPFVPVGITGTASAIGKITGVREDENGLTLTATGGQALRAAMPAMGFGKREPIRFYRPAKPRSWLYRKVHAKRLLREQLEKRTAELEQANEDLAEAQAIVDQVRQCIDPED